MGRQNAGRGAQRWHGRAAERGQYPSGSELCRSPSEFTIEVSRLVMLMMVMSRAGRGQQHSALMRVEPLGTDLQVPTTVQCPRHIARGHQRS